jgi:hypothetical protein
MRLLRELGRASAQFASETSPTLHERVTLFTSKSSTYCNWFYSVIRSRRDVKSGQGLLPHSLLAPSFLNRLLHKSHADILASSIYFDLSRIRSFPKHKYNSPSLFSLNSSLLSILSSLSCQFPSIHPSIHPFTPPTGCSRCFS